MNIKMTMKENELVEIEHNKIEVELMFSMLKVSFPDLKDETFLYIKNEDFEKFIQYLKDGSLLALLEAVNKKRKEEK